MKKYYIEIENDKPVGQKMDDLFLQKRFLGHDFDNGLPPKIVEYVCSEPPSISRFEKINITLLYVDNKVVENLQVTNMTVDERQVAAELKRRNFVLETGYNSWKYDDEIDQFYAPISVQNAINNGIYKWNEENLEWVLVDVKGEDL